MGLSCQCHGNGSPHLTRQFIPLSCLLTAYSGVLIICINSSRSRNISKTIKQNVTVKYLQFLIDKDLH